MDLGERGKSFLLVGGTSGIGYATAELLVAEGARVAVVGRDLDTARRKAALLCAGADPSAALGLAADGRLAGQLHAAADDAIRVLGGLDGLAVTAGPVSATGAFLDFCDADWEEYFQSILMTTVRSCHAVLPHLVDRGGSIVVTAAYSIRAPKPALLPYVAMKAAVAAVAKSLALEFGPRGVRVNCVCPGATATEALAGAAAAAVELYGGSPNDALNRYMREEWKMPVALGRVGNPVELAELYAFLLSDRAAYLTGAVINQDGGTHF